MAATTLIETASYSHATESGAAHGEWMKRQQAIAAEYHAKAMELARWRVKAMADADNEYRSATFAITERLLEAAEAGLRDPQPETGA